MSLDLSSLRAMRKTSSNTLAKITSELSKQEQGSGFKRTAAERMSKATVDKAGNGSAVIRFLPAVGDGMPWAKTYDKGFQGPSGKWYIEKCLTTIGQPDPVVEATASLWTGTEEDKDKARKMKRRLSYYANVLVIKDPSNPENEGQVKLFKFGKKLFDKVKDKLQPTFEDETPVDVFDPFVGANFRLRIRKVDGYSNTDKSEFDSSTELCGGDEGEMLTILNARHDLSEFTDPSSFKSYDDLAKKLDLVMSNETSSSFKKASEFMLEDEAPAAKPAKVESKVKEEPKIKETKKSEDEDDLSFFEELLN